MQIAQRTLTAISRNFNGWDNAGRLLVCFDSVRKAVGEFNPDLVETSAFVGLFKIDY